MVNENEVRETEYVEANVNFEGLEALKVLKALEFVVSSEC